MGRHPRAGFTGPLTPGRVASTLPASSEFQSRGNPSSRIRPLGSKGASRRFTGSGLASGRRRPEEQGSDDGCVDGRGDNPDRPERSPELGLRGALGAGPALANWLCGTSFLPPSAAHSGGKEGDSGESSGRRDSHECATVACAAQLGFPFCRTQTESSGSRTFLTFERPWPKRHIRSIIS